MCRVMFLMALMCLTVATILAQDPVKVDPKHYKVVFEDAQVRVLRVSLGPRKKTPIHEHPAAVVVFLTDARWKFTLPDGKTEERQGEAGQALWAAAEKHAGENLTDNPVEVIVVKISPPNGWRISRARLLARRLDARVRCCTDPP